MPTNTPAKKTAPNTPPKPAVNPAAVVKPVAKPAEKLTPAIVPKSNPTNSQTAKTTKTVKITPETAQAKSTTKKSAKTASNNVVVKAEKVKKVKLVRDSFTIPKPEYLVLAALKERALHLKVAVKKGELLRAGIKALEAMDDKQLLNAIGAVPSLKTGRPSK